MPITKSAIKKQRVDKTRIKINEPIRGRVKANIKAARTNPTAKTIAQLYSAVDRAVAKKILPLRRAARLKARIVKMSRAKLPKSPFTKQ